ncbi:uracil-DNA glycosylase [Pelotalea chapellei]|uniref:Uracil-DNA glycosylase n=1 Tax=Pelotalea chapellei TaxID=44671 RepID=A0ABS5U3E7_9BACT|nr:uracil-DNA glycosylase [Pelotalea chapellei]MBT1070165.1 uracil-DNA glycosylase [Pelotalea chapellei]
MSLAERLISTLPVGLPDLFNPWHEHCPHEIADDGPAARLERLALHLDCNPAFILVGEAVGYQGCRYSGIAFTSERLLGEGSIPRIPAPAGRLSMRRLPFSEPSATIVWKTLQNLGIAERTILWNALQLHPHKPGNPWSNRTPTPQEMEYGAPALKLLINSFPTARIVAVGKKSEGLMVNMGIIPAATVRHPANGGATLFAAGIAELMR